MSMNEKKVPKRRFKEFQNVGAWEQRKLSDVAKFAKGNGYSKNDIVEQGVPIILYGRLYTRYQSVIEDVDTFVVARKGSIYSNGNEVIVPASGETAEDISRASAVIKSGILLGGDLNIIYPNKSIDSKFLALTISNGKQQKELSKRAQGKSVVHLHNSDLQEVDLLYPIKEEQLQIGNFFKEIDDLITLHQRKLDKLKSLKKAYLTDMFPAEGESKPKLRFAGFTDDWEQRKLIDISNIITGTTPPTSDESNYDGDKLFVSPADIQGNRYVENTITTLSEKGFNLGRILKPGTVLFVSIGSTIGKVAQIKDCATTNQQINAVIPDEKMDCNFVFSMLENKASDIRKMSAQQAVPIINKTTFGEIQISYPKKVEQEQIGEFFSKLDNLIALHQRKLEKLQNIKKAYLNEMFV